MHIFTDINLKSNFLVLHYLNEGPNLSGFQLLILEQVELEHF